MRKPRIENKYNLTPPGINNLVVLDRSKVCAPLFWRNNVIGAWCITRTTGSKSDFEFGCESDFWLGIYDEKDEIKSNFSSFGGMCNYNPSKFYDEKEIENKNDLEIQEKALEVVNRLIDEGILGFAEKDKKEE